MNKAYLSFSLFFYLLLVLPYAYAFLPQHKIREYYVGSVVQPLFVEDPLFSRNLVDSLGVIDLVQLPIRLFGNTTSDIDNAVTELETWVKAFNGYDIALQTYYSGFGFYTEERTQHLEQYNLTTLSQTFYTNYFSKLGNLTKKYSNIVLYIGFNEPYLHVTESEIPTLLEREYTTWKDYSTVPFSIEMFSPCEFWREKIQFLSESSYNYTLFKGFWANYSDYIGVNLWLPEAKTPPASPPYEPLTAEDTDPANLRKLALDTWELLKAFSSELNKPILIAEFPIQYPDIYDILLKDGAMKKPNIAIHFCFMTANPPHDDTLYGVNPSTADYWKIEPTYYDFLNAVTYDSMELVIQKAKLVIAVSIFAVCSSFLYIRLTKKRARA